MWKLFLKESISEWLLKRYDENIRNEKFHAINMNNVHFKLKKQYNTY